jgi:hypothetical protein
MAGSINPAATKTTAAEPRSEHRIRGVMGHWSTGRMQHPKGWDIGIHERRLILFFFRCKQPAFIIFYKLATPKCKINSPFKSNGHELAQDRGKSEFYKSRDTFSALRN